MVSPVCFSDPSERGVPITSFTTEAEVNTFRTFGPAEFDNRPLNVLAHVTGALEELVKGFTEKSLKEAAAEAFPVLVGKAEVALGVRRDLDVALLVVDRILGSFGPVLHRGFRTGSKELGRTDNSRDDPESPIGPKQLTERRTGLEFFVASEVLDHGVREAGRVPHEFHSVFVELHDKCLLVGLR